MTLTFSAAVAILREHRLLREIISGSRWTLAPSRLPHMKSAVFTAVSYDSRAVNSHTLLFCKGRFRPEYLDAANAAGLSCYVAETDYSARTRAVGIVVTDVRRAMSLLGAAFYGYPQHRLTLAGITGTKGKTTTAYFTQAILNAFSGGKAALFSSVSNCLDGEHHRESNLTTPESLDLFRMMRQAADAGMRYLVMEVSSQAYKVERVYGLTFDVGAFLNISPDHISRIEHPTFEDYLFCKRQIVANSNALVLGADAQHAELIREDAAAHHIPVRSFALRERASTQNPQTAADVVAVPSPGSPYDYRLFVNGRDRGAFTLGIEGDFNGANAAAAVAIAGQLGVEPNDPAVRAIAAVRIPGRMERFVSLDGLIAYVDYAHNNASVTALLDYIDERYGNRKPRITLVTGSAGDKAYDRREGIVRAAQDRIARFIFTTEDTDTEPNEHICRQMLGYVTNPDVSTAVILNRAEAIADAVADARRHTDRLNILLMIGKGEERWIKRRGGHIPYEGDPAAVRRLFGEQER